MSGFTKGNWTALLPVGACDGEILITSDNDGEVIARVHRAEDASILAAAPELYEACQTFAEWLRREDAGSEGQPWAGKRGTPEGEAAWREWYDENLRLCALAQEQALAALSKAAGEGV